MVMDVSQLRAFLAVAEELHFGRAAERLHMAQPPLSRTIQHLERELNTRLFERNTRSVRLTASGRALLVSAQEVMHSLRRAAESVRDAAEGETGLVRIVFSGISTYPLVAALARSLRASKPGIQLELSSQTFALPAMRLLINRETDLALGRWDVIPAGIAEETVMRDSLVVAVPLTSPIADRPVVSFVDLKEEKFISLPPYEGSVMPERLQRLARVAGFVPDVVQIAPDTQSALVLVSAGIGSHVTLASVARNVRDENFRFIPIPEVDAEVDLTAAWRAQDTSPALRIVLEHLRELKTPR
jgi:DNA-binding transcriptional LysR family regulator